MTPLSVVVCAVAVCVLTAGLRALVGKIEGADWPATDKGRVWLTWFVGLAASVGEAALRDGGPWSWNTLAQAVMAAVMAGGGFSQVRKMLGLDASASGVTPQT